MGADVKLHPHAAERLAARGAEEHEVAETVEHGEQFPAKYGRTGFRRNFVYEREWQGKRYATKQIEAYAVYEDGDWLVITVITRFF
ncbi:MAG: hypothetical protein A2Z18_08215 [Armatimonadetes bacterium RBG_16_58_9]|nr:MAG: hypothetical protein A2Z18_08215 [Armatimonadetes bacterium RBG_16_58_9]